MSGRNNDFCQLKRNSYPDEKKQQLQYWQWKLSRTTFFCVLPPLPNQNAWKSTYVIKANVLFLMIVQEIAKIYESDRIIMIFQYFSSAIQLVQTKVTMIIMVFMFFICLYVWPCCKSDKDVNDIPMFFFHTCRWYDHPGVSRMLKHFSKKSWIVFRRPQNRIGIETLFLRRGSGF